MNLVWIAAGGALGSLARHGVYVLCRHLATSPARASLESGPTPWGVWATLCVNVGGSFLFGLLAGWLSTQGEPRPALRLFALAGFLGAFTTFSTFAFQAVELGEIRAFALLSVHAIANNVLAIAAAWFGWRLLRVTV